MRAENSLLDEQHKGAPPLCVDLDGTLLVTDMLWESVLRLVKYRPYLLFALPFWLLSGKAYLKRRVAEYIEVNPATLPYREDVLSFITQERKNGRWIVLITASDQRLVEPVAKHLGLFDEVMASDGIVNLKGSAKRKILEERFGYHQFDYIGNSTADLAVWQSANAAFLVKPSKGTLRKAKCVSSVERIFSDKGSCLRVIGNALRCHQWSKNLLIFVPLIASHQALDISLLLSAIIAFAAVSFCASSIYIINDFLDVDADRQHPRKKFRPFAAGTLSIPAGVFLAAMMSIAGFLIGWGMLPLQFTGLLMVYIALTLGYSLVLKGKSVADVMTLALLYTLRILMGGAAVGIVISPWLLAFSVFLFLSLAFVKRHGEVTVVRAGIRGEVPGRGYNTEDGDWMKNMGATSGYMSILVLALYINSPDVTALYRRPEILWFACAPLLYWIGRIWLLASRGKIDDDPLVFATKDKVSYAVGSLVLLTLIAATL